MDKGLVFIATQYTREITRPHNKNGELNIPNEQTTNYITGERRQNTRNKKHDAIYHPGIIALIQYLGTRMKNKHPKTLMIGRVEGSLNDDMRHRVA